MSYNKSYPKGPFVGALVFLVIIWTLWTLDIHHSMSLVTDETSTPVVVQHPKTPSESIPIPSPAPEPPAAPAPPAASVVEVVQSVTSQSPKPSSPSGGSLKAPAKDRPLILYAYSETDSARTNLKFFVAHGLHAAADFVFIINGESKDTSIIPVADNIRIVQRKNECYDIGAYAEILVKDDLYKKYKKFIMLNASIRGPFMPYWAESCWSDRYLNKITDEVKLIGMTANCWPIFHVQSMIWATDLIGLKALLFPTPEVIDTVTNTPIPNAAHMFPHLHPGINSCFDGWNSAVSAEIGSSAVIKASGYKLDVMMNAYHSSEKYEQECDSSHNGDVLTDHAYFGTNVHPYETIFLKSNRNIDPTNLEKMSEWVEGSGYSSYDYCS